MDLCVRLGRRGMLSPLRSIRYFPCYFSS